MTNRSERNCGNVATCSFRNKLIAFESFAAWVNPSGWEFPWLTRDAKVDEGSSTVTRQGAWVLTGEMASSALGFGFWALAARLFSTDQVGTAAALVSLSSLATSIAMLGLDNGLVRFATKVRRPRKLIGQILAITGSLAVVSGLGLALFVLSLGETARAELWLLVGISVVLTVSQTWLQVTDGAILAAGRSQILAYRAFAYGLIKIGVLVAVVSAGTAGLFASYAIPMLVVVLGTFLLLPRIWPRKNESGTSPSIREVAALSGGNYVSGFAYSLPSRLGPSLIFIFFDPTSVAFFFISLQLAEVLNYVSEAIAKSLFAHGSREDRLDRSLAARMRGLLLVVLVPLIAVGIVAAPLVLSILGEAYSEHALALQLFLLAVLPKAFYQILKAQFNVEKRVVALMVAGSATGVSTLAFLVTGLILRWSADLLPSAWIVGGVAGVAVAQYLAARGPRGRTISADLR